MEQIAKDFLNHLMAYTHRATGPFLRESTLKTGAKLMWISTILLLMVSNVIKLNGGEFIGIQISLKEGTNVLYFVIALVLLYFSIEYFFAFNYDIEKWRTRNSFDNQRSRKLLKLLEDEKAKNSDELQKIIDGNSDIKNLSASLERWIKIDQYDKQLSSVMERNYNKISKMYNLRFYSGLLPIIVFLVVLIFTGYVKLVK